VAHPGVMCFSYAIRAVYIEACVMFVRGGVYRVVKSALGDTLAKFSVSALMFDYILTGPISGVSAGQYLVGVVNEILKTQGISWGIPRDGFRPDRHRRHPLFLAEEHHRHPREQ